MLTWLWTYLGWALLFVFLVNSWRHQRLSRTLAGLLALYAAVSVALRLLR